MLENIQQNPLQNCFQLSLREYLLYPQIHSLNTSSVLFKDNGAMSSNANQELQH